MKRVVTLIVVLLIGLSCFGQDWKVEQVQADEFKDREAYVQISYTGISGTEPYAIAFILNDYMNFVVSSNVVFNKNAQTGQVGFILGFYESSELVSKVNSDGVTYRHAGLSVIKDSYRIAYFREKNKGSALYIRYSDDELVDMIQQGKLNKILSTPGNTAHAIFAWLSSSECRSVRLLISVYSDSDLDIILPSLVGIEL